MNDHVLLEIKDGIGTVTLNRPERLNTLAIPTIDRLVDVLSEVGASEEVRVVVLAGAGERFCAGADQAEMVARDSQAWEPIVRRYLDPIRAIVSLDKPVIARCHGNVVGGGLGLALASDFRIGAEGSRYCAPFVKLALAGCDMCLKAHEAAVKQGGLNEENGHDAVRISAILNGVAVALDSIV